MTLDYFFKNNKTQELTAVSFISSYTVNTWEVARENELKNSAEPSHLPLGCFSTDSSLAPHSTPRTAVYITQ